MVQKHTPDDQTNGWQALLSFTLVASVLIGGSYLLMKAAENPRVCWCRNCQRSTIFYGGNLPFQRESCYWCGGRVKVVRPATDEEFRDAKQAVR